MVKKKFIPNASSWITDLLGLTQTTDVKEDEKYRESVKKVILERMRKRNPAAVVPVTLSVCVAKRCESREY